MADWWQWSQKREKEALTFAVVGVEDLELLFVENL